MAKFAKFCFVGLIVIIIGGVSAIIGMNYHSSAEVSAGVGVLPTAADPSRSLVLAGGSACVGVDEFNSTARYVVDSYSLDGLRLRDMDATSRKMLSGAIVMKQMNARGRGACVDLDAVWQHQSSQMLQHIGGYSAR